MNKFLCLLMLFVVAQVSFAQTHLYVAPNGNDSWTGTLNQPNVINTDGPKLTLDGARDAIRVMKTKNTLSSLGVIVDVMPGKYYMGHSFYLGDNDSGTQTAPIIYRSSVIHQAWLEGGVSIKNWLPLDSRLLPRVQSSIATKLVCADLKALGVTDFGSFPGSNWAGKSPIPGAGAIELFVNGYRQTVARWPNTGYAIVKSATDGTSFVADFSTSHLITNEPDVWLCGFSNGLNWAWDSSSVLINRTTNTATQTIANPYPNKAGGRFYIKNSLAELDSPGEYYVDKGTGFIVWYPNVDLSKADSYVSTNIGVPQAVPSDMVRFTDVHDVQFIGFTGHYFRGDAFVLQRSYRNTILGNVVSNIEGSAVRLYELGGAPGICHDNLIKSNDIRNLGEAGVQITAGDSKTLIAANNQVLNNAIKNFGVIIPSTRCGVDLRGVGNVAQHNDIQTSPHIAIIAGGNNQVVDSNHINNACMDASDAGAIYTGGAANFAEGGHQFTNNYIENTYGRLDTSIWAIYLDSKACRDLIQNNIVRNSNTAYFINGGREITVSNNIAIDCETFIQVNDYNPLHASPYPYPPQLTAVDYQNPPYSVQYPRLPNILNDDPQWPKWDQLFTNTGLRTPKQYYIRTDSIANVHMDVSVPALNLKNTISWLGNTFSTQSMFVNEAAGNFTPVFGSALAMSGFKPLLASNIGIITDQYITRP